MRKHIKNVLKVIEWGMFGILLVLFAIILSPILPTKSFISSYAVVSGSMEPVIGKGSIAFITPHKTDHVRNGTIIAFTHPNDSRITVLHRIIGNENTNRATEYHTKGDANNAVDNWVVTSDQIIGQYTFSVPFIGYLADYIRNPLGFAIIVGIPALILLIMQIKSIKEGIEQEVQKRITEQAKKHQQATKIVILLFSISLLGITPIYALLTSDVTINGITLSTKETFANVEMKLSSNKKKLKVTVDAVDGYKKISYSLTYTSNDNPQGIIGESSVDNSNTFIKTFTLGTCSEDVCIYHTNPHDFKIIITLEKPNGDSVTITENL